MQLATKILIPAYVF